MPTPDRSFESSHLYVLDVIFDRFACRWGRFPLTADKYLSMGDKQRARDLLTARTVATFLAEGRASITLQELAQNFTTPSERCSISTARRRVQYAEKAGYLTVARDSRKLWDHAGSGFQLHWAAVRNHLCLDDLAETLQRALKPFHRLANGVSELSSAGVGELSSVLGQPLSNQSSDDGSAKSLLRPTFENAGCGPETVPSESPPARPRRRGRPRTSQVLRELRERSDLPPIARASCRPSVRLEIIQHYLRLSRCGCADVKPSAADIMPRVGWWEPTAEERAAAETREKVWRREGVIRWLQDVAVTMGANDVAADSVGFLLGAMDHAISFGEAFHENLQHYQTDLPEITDDVLRLLSVPVEQLRHARELIAATRQPADDHATMEETGKPRTKKQGKPRQQVADALLQICRSGEPFTNDTDLAQRTRSDRRTVKRAREETPELREWHSKRFRTARVIVFQELVAHTPAPAAAEPQEGLSDEEVRQAFQYVRDKAGPDERPILDAKTDDEKRVLAELTAAEPAYRKEIWPDEKPKQREIGRRLSRRHPEATPV